jgi:hypothetical protein
VKRDPETVSNYSCLTKRCLIRLSRFSADITPSSLVPIIDKVFACTLRDNTFAFCGWKFLLLDPCVNAFELVITGALAEERVRLEVIIICIGTACNNGFSFKIDIVDILLSWI